MTKTFINFFFLIDYKMRSTFAAFPHTYSAYHLRINKDLFMKQKCQLQMGIAKYKNVATPVTTRGIITTHQHFQMSYIT